MSYDRMFMILLFVISTIALILGSVAVRRQYSHNVVHIGDGESSSVNGLYATSGVTTGYSSGIQHTIILTTDKDVGTAINYNWNKYGTNGLHVEYFVETIATLKSEGVNSGTVYDFVKYLNAHHGDLITLHIKYFENGESKHWYQQYPVNILEYNY